MELTWGVWVGEDIETVGEEVGTCEEVLTVEEEAAVGVDQKKELKIEDGLEVEEEGIEANGNTVSLKITCLDR